MCSCSCSWSVSSSFWRCFGVFAGSLFGLPPHEEGPCAAGSTVCSSRAAQTIAPPVVSPPLPRRMEGQLPVPVRPWREVKSRRGAPKRIHTEGFACPNQQCAYFGITDAHIHALVGDGRHGHAERIQTFRCQACRTTFTAGVIPLVPFENPFPSVARVLSALAEGLDPSAAERVFGYRQATIITWLSRAGEHAQTLHQHSFCNLHLPHLQLDELRTRLRCAKQVLWLAGIDPLHEDSACA